MNETMINEVLKHYHITPTSTKRHGKVLQVTTSERTFALKPLPAENEAQFLETQYILHSESIPALPVFLTTYGEPIARVNGQSYYLTQWIDNVSKNANQKWEALIDRLSWLHRRTGKQISDLNNHIKKERNPGLNARRQAFENFMFQAEHRTYPSPFEQRILVLFHRLMSDVEASENIKGALEENETKKRKVVLCHGKPDSNHIKLSVMGPYLINYDHSYWGSPASDLAKVFQSRDLPVEMLSRLYNQYQSVNQLTTDEKRWLMAELFEPVRFEELIMAYQNDTNPNELQFVEQLHVLSDRRQQLQDFFNQIDQEINDETDDA